MLLGDAAVCLWLDRPPLCSASAGRAVGQGLHRSQLLRQEMEMSIVVKVSINSRRWVALKTRYSPPDSPPGQPRFGDWPYFQATGAPQIYGSCPSWHGEKECNFFGSEAFADCWERLCVSLTGRKKKLLSRGKTTNERCSRRSWVTNALAFIQSSFKSVLYVSRITDIFNIR